MPKSSKHLIALFLAFSTLVFGALPSAASPIVVSNPFTAQDALGLSPFWDWKTIESENFRVIFPAELAEVANRATNYLEEAHSFLSPLLRWQPDTKTTILIIDNSDSANGLTSTFARIGITLWITAPESWYGTSYYDDYLRLLVIHEYTHYLNMDSTHGYASLGRVLFGDIFVPNALWPPWMLEGLAVFMETRFTHSGRGRSPFYEMVLRAAVDEGVLDTRSYITLDKINGTNPYTPGGDTRYQYGYHLMNRITQQETHGTTADGDTPTSGHEDLLGIMSDRSSHRIPFFISQNVENVSGKDWSALWSEFVSDATLRANTALKKIRAQPVTHYTLLTEKKHELSNNVYGVAASPDGNYLAYTLSSADRRSGLFLHNLKTGETRRIDDKYDGVGMKFTPDSKALIFSELQQRSIYYSYSDLHVYFTDENKRHPLTDSARAMDPDVSSDGKWVVFTYSDKATSGLAIAPLESLNGDYHLGPIEKVYPSALLDHLANPKFSSDGKKVYFTLHPSGKSQEDLMQFDVATQKVSVLHSDGHYNQFPTVDGKGNLFFVSDKTGIYNLFRYRGETGESGQRSGQEPEMVTNMETGIFIPTFRPDPEHSTLYASVYSTSGWDLAQLELSQKSLSPEAATLAPPPAPPMGEHSSSDKRNVAYSVDNYSIWPTILPRGWTPLLGWDAEGLSAGGEVVGYDAVNRHRYVFAGSYSSQLQTADGYALYSNRSWGPSLDFSLAYLTGNVNQNGAVTTYTRELDSGVTLSLPIQYTYSYLTPSISANFQRVFGYQGSQSSSTTGGSSLTSISPIVGNVDARITFSDQEYSGLAIHAEKGRLTQLGVRTYFLDSNTWKFFFYDQENLQLFKHWVLSPSIKGQWASHFLPSFPSASGVLQGRNSQTFFGPFAGDGLGQLSIRGYPNYTFFTRLASVGALDLNFPVARIFSGLGTNPAFLDNLYGFTFAEATYFPNSGQLLPAAGGGLRLSGEFFSVLTTTFSLEYHYGFRQDFGGTGDLFFQLFLSAFSF